MTRIFTIESPMSAVRAVIRRASPALAAFVFVAAATISIAPAGAAAANDPHGMWLRPEGGVQFSFYDCGALLCAKVVSAKNAADQAGVGTVILRGARQTSANEWKGKLFNADDGKTYDGIITVKSATELTLKGCLWGVLCSGETWTRVGAPPAHAALKPQTQAKATLEAAE